jgi:hypothetical protein
MSSQKVRELLGDPIEIKNLDTDEEWIYREREEKAGVTYLLGVVPIKNTEAIWDFMCTVRFAQGMVHEARIEKHQIQ